MKNIIWLLLIALAVFISSCSKHSKLEELRQFPVDDLEGIVARVGVSLDPDTSADGNGSLRIDVGDTTTVPLYELKNMELENAKVVYRAKVKTENVIGRAYLEMVCGLMGEEEYFSRGLQYALTGTTDWTILETPFAFETGQMSSYFKLNLVIEGSGTVWVDDIRLLKGTIK
ncbi:MAG: hypothetical protein AB1546_05445 [bacterium]